MAVKAILWERDGDKASCLACAHACRIREGAAGRCRVRVVRNGNLFSLSSDQVVAVNLDPVEKKPLYHFLPGTTTLSFGTPGCNMTCSFCQNHTLSQGAVPAFAAEADQVPDAFLDNAVTSAKEAGAASISFTYNEPCVSPELILSLAPRAKEAHLASILVSNAYASKESMDAFRPYVRAANFDLKAFSDTFYAKFCGAALRPVLETIVRAVEFGWWVELTTLLIPGENDSDKELTDIARFITEHLGECVPWHISRFRPMYRMSRAVSTPVSALERAVGIGRAEGLHFVYAGNVPGHDAENTLCSACGKVAVSRVGYMVSGSFDGHCPYCGHMIPGVWRCV